MGKSRAQTLNGNASLMEQVLERDNLILALKQVTRNKGVAGVDGMQVEELPAYLKQNWLEIKEKLLTGCYQPQVV